MSFRHTAITEFLYKHGRDKELENIEKVLNEYGHFEWHARGNDKQLGYFHGVIKDLDGHETRLVRDKIIEDIFKRTGVEIQIVIE